jgi:hypothetical protein
MALTTRRALTKPKQLTAYTTVGTSAVQPWATDAHGTLTPVEGVMVQLSLAAAAGAYIEIGGPDITPGNGLQLGPGDSDLVIAPNAGSVWIVPSVSGLSVRGQVR